MLVLLELLLLQLQELGLLLPPSLASSFFFVLTQCE
jgi:hypothetical protein